MPIYQSVGAFSRSPGTAKLFYKSWFTQFTAVVSRRRGQGAAAGWLQVTCCRGSAWIWSDSHEKIPRSSRQYCSYLSFICLFSGPVPHHDASWQEYVEWSTWSAYDGHGNAATFYVNCNHHPGAYSRVSARISALAGCYLLCGCDEMCPHVLVMAPASFSPSD